VILTGLLLSTTGLSAAVVIPVNNPSFEDTTGVTFMSCGSPNCQFSDGLIPQWTISTGLAGLLQPALPPVVPAQFNFIPDGNNTAYNNGGTISQTLSSTVQNDLIYTFTVDLGLRLDFSTFHSSANIVLTPQSGPSIVVPALGTPPTNGNWSQYTATFIGTPANAGDSITIQLVAAELQGNFDNVHLTADVIPEPGSGGLLGLPLAGLLAIAYFRRLRTRPMTVTNSYQS